MNDLICAYLKADFFESTLERNKILEEIITYLMNDFKINKETARRIWTKYINGFTEADIINKYESVKELINMIKENN